MPKNKTLKELERAHGLTISAPVVLQGVDILKHRTDTAKLSQLAGGTLQLGVTGAVSQVAFDLAANPFAVKKKKKKRS